MPARIRNGAATGIWNVRYCDSWSRWRSESIWKDVLGPEENNPDKRFDVLDKIFILS